MRSVTSVPAVHGSSGFRKDSGASNPERGEAEKWLAAGNAGYPGLRGRCLPSYRAQGRVPSAAKSLSR